ncbi:hypothetical protein [Micromonospora sp. NBC_01813]|uniref:hypothetical protein n=1 Tax=Micromonospora sp. NBC_01813 TaxID=2975988 RepID=UPI002DD90CF3|nr:hypothetical protein [Micromonospora sp. NBC_01813]WSA10170.1 hypothetical protein OG958_05065 [Micromonospora sp. NBC_01813]
MPPGTRWVVIGLACFLASAGVLLGTRLVTNAYTGDLGEAQPPGAVLDANAVSSADGATSADRRVAGSTRLVAVTPKVLLDSREVGALPAGTDVIVPMPPLPDGTRDVLVEVSILAAKGPGEVAVGQAQDRTTALTVAKSKAQQSATVAARLDDDGSLRVAATGGGDLLVRLVGAFEPVERSGAGRVVTVPATQVVRLVTATQGKTASFAIADVSQLAAAGPISAVLLQVAADVGPKGGLVSVGRSPTELDQTVYWSATSGTDRTRHGLLFVPVSEGTIHLRYEAGTELRADLVGYVTGDGAPEEVAGLVAPVSGPAADPAPVAAGSGVQISVAFAAEAVDVPADRIGAALTTVTVNGDGGGEATVGSSGAPTLNLTVLAGAARSASVLVDTPEAAVRVDSSVSATVTVTPRVLILTG